MSRDNSTQPWQVLTEVVGAGVVAWGVAAASTGLIAWPLLVFVPMFFVFLYLLIASLRGWWPSKPGPTAAPPDHAVQLRGIASTLRDRIDADDYPAYGDTEANGQLWESVFEAHFPEIQGLVATFAELTGSWQAAKTQFSTETGRALIMQFQEKDGWDPIAIAACFRAHTMSIAEGRMRHIDQDKNPGAITWEGHIVFISRFGPSPERMNDLTTAALQLLDWLKAAMQSDSAKSFVTDRTASRGARAATLYALEPVIHLQELSKSKACILCNPMTNNRDRSQSRSHLLLVMRRRLSGRRHHRLGTGPRGGNSKS